MSTILKTALVITVMTCGTPDRRSEAVSGPVPGTLWVTPAQPWRVPFAPSFVVATGNAALLVASGGWLGRLDLMTGQLVREGQIEDMVIWDVLALPDGQWLVVGIKDNRTRVVTIDHDSLVTTTVVTGEAVQAPPGTYVGTSAGAAVVDEGIALAGLGLPLAIYDPATWKVRRVVDPEPRWRKLRGSGTTLYAEGLRTSSRFDLATGRIEETPWRDDRGGRYSAYAAQDHGVNGIAIDVDQRRVAHVPGVTPIAIDAAGGQMAVRAGRRILVYRLADGEPISRYDLEELGYGEWRALSFIGPRLAVCVDSVFRMIDLNTGAMTPAGTPPFGVAEHLRVANKGAIVHIGRQALSSFGGTVEGTRRVTRVGRGNVTSSPRTGVLTIVTPDPGEISLFAEVIDEGARSRVNLRAHGQDRVQDSWLVDGALAQYEAWMSSHRALVVPTGRFDPARGGIGSINLWLLRGGPAAESARITRLGPAINTHARIRDLDVDDKLAVIEMDNAMHLVKLGERGDGSSVAVLPPPDCSSRKHLRRAGIERGGDRVYVQADHEVAVFRRSGARVGAARLPTRGRIAFVPGHDEVLAGGWGDSLVLWNVVSGEQRVLSGIAGLDDIAVSPDGHRAALAFSDGRLAAVDLDTLRRAMKPAAPTPVTLPAHCDTTDPFDLATH